MKVNLLLIGLMFLASSLKSQVEIGKPKLISKQALYSFGVPTQKSDNWDITIKNYSSYDHTASIPKEAFNELKARANAKKNETHSNIVKSGSRNGNPPVMRVNFQGNIQGNSVPPDNSMAVSNNGFVVSAINSNIVFTNSKGDLVFTQNLSDFFAFAGAITSVYDPRILYDIENRRFIVLSLNGNTPSTSKILVAFSKTEDPSAGWYYYSFDGNPLNDDNWFDYPNVGLTDNNLFFTGLMRNNLGLWEYSVIYQIDKKKCFDGEETDWAYYSDVNNADGEKAFNLVPTHSAWNNYPASKMYFVSNVANGGDQYHIHSIDGNVNPQVPLMAYQLTGPQTELAPDGEQPNTANVMNTFDSRIWNAMELNGTIHFGAHVNSPANTSGILYGRVNTQDMTVTGSLYFEEDYDYGFPSIAAIGDEETSDSVLINILKTGKTLFPSQVAVVCTGTGSVFNFSEEVMTKQGTGFVNQLAENRERWGDYTTVSRRFFQNVPEVWITGCYGRGSYGTWLAQYFRDSTDYIVDFIASKTTLNPNESTTFSLLPNNHVTLKEWKLNNGSEVITSESNPSLMYMTLGNYDIEVTVEDNAGNASTIKKEKFITVIPKAIAPIANFAVDRDTIYQGESVQFMDLSANDPLSYIWTFNSGIPSSSTLVNPTVKYEKVGSFLVNLTVKNTAGSDNETKQKFITVLQALKPQANFTANTTNGSVNDAIMFFDNSINNPTTWEWNFEGGNPQTSNEKNPIVAYAVDGQYDVRLIASNFAGRDTLYKEQYIKIGGTSTKEEIQNVRVNLYPNPVVEGNLNIDIELEKSEILDVKLYSQSGQFVKSLLSQKVKSGYNQLNFNSLMLNRGWYFITLESHSSKWKQTLVFEKL